MQTPYAMTDVTPDLRLCLSEPIAQLHDAVRYLDAAVSAHLLGKRNLASELFRLADMDEIRRWTKSIWANSSVHVRYPSAEPTRIRALRAETRMPSQVEKQRIHTRDGYNCRFCNMPVIRSHTRKRIHDMYPDAVGWGSKEVEQHAAFQAMWAQYDHIVPHARGGLNDLENLILTCAPCNFGRGDATLQEVSVADPRARQPVPSHWDGLERFR